MSELDDILWQTLDTQFNKAERSGTPRPHTKRQIKDLILTLVSESWKEACDQVEVKTDTTAIGASEMEFILSEKVRAL